MSYRYGNLISEKLESHKLDNALPVPNHSGQSPIQNSDFKSPGKYNPDLTLVKFGGSLITDKHKPYTARLDTIDRLAQEFSTAWQLRESKRWLVGNGAGSFAHQSANKFKTAQGFNTNSQKTGASLVHADVIKLHLLLIEAFLRYQLPVLSVFPLQLFVAQSGQAQTIRLELIEDIWSKGFIPVVCGDIVLDHQQGCSIFSTDRVLSILARELVQKRKVQEAFLWSIGNYEGVYDGQKKIIPRITPSNIATWQKFLQPSQTVDVTGGMLAKVQDLLSLTQVGITSCIASGQASGLLCQLLSEGPKAGRGTIIAAA